MAPNGTNPKGREMQSRSENSRMARADGNVYEEGESESEQRLNSHEPEQRRSTVLAEGEGDPD